MTNAVATVDQEQTPRLPTLQTGGAIRAIVPQDFDSAWRIANAVCKAGMAPRGLDTPEKATIAILHGLEVGLTPMNALQSIAVINSRATIWGDGALGLVQASGKMSSHEEWYEGEGESRKALCVVVRKGDPKPKRGEFSVSDAKKAGLWGKAGPWQQYSDRMLKMRARAFALRDGFSDVLRGLGIAEEVQDTPAIDVTPRGAGVPISQRIAASQSQTTAGDANHSTPPHNATLHERTTEVIASATDAHGHPDRVETADGSLPGGSHEVGASESEPNRPSDSTNSDSLQSPPHAAAAKPVADVAPTPDATGTLSDSSASGPADDGAQAGNVTSSTGLRSALPQGWSLAYVAALRRAQSKPSLAKYAKAFWAQYGSFDDHKDGPDGATAAAIFDAFQSHFGQSEALAAALREIV